MVSQHAEPLRLMAFRCWTYSIHGVFYLFSSIKKFGMSSRELCLKPLHEYNVLIVPGTAFGDSGEGYIRISYATSMERLETFINAFKSFV